MDKITDAVFNSLPLVFMLFGLALLAKALWMTFTLL